MKKLCFLIILVSFASVVAFANDTHPVETGSFSCTDCHSPNGNGDVKSESPSYNEWKKSLHGLNNVKCVTCHGDASTQAFVVAVPDKTCMSCHPKEYTNNKKSAQSCFSCHKAHDFPVVKEKYKVHSKK